MGGFYGKLCKMGEQCVKNHSQPPVRAIRNTHRLIQARLTLISFNSLMFHSHLILAHNIIPDKCFFLIIHCTVLYDSSQL